MKVIFLDFDGVITTQKSKGRLDSEKMAMVKRICDETGAKIVISSSWRRYSLQETIAHITDKTCCFVKENPFLMPELVIDITPRLCLMSHSDKEICNMSCPRGVEIEYWLNNHKDIENYLILDDDTDMLSDQESHFIRTDFLDGISEHDVEWAIKMLNGKILQ